MPCTAPASAVAGAATGPASPEPAPPGAAGCASVGWLGGPPGAGSNWGEWVAPTLKWLIPGLLASAAAGAVARAPAAAAGQAGPPRTPSPATTAQANARRADGTAPVSAPGQ